MYSLKIFLFIYIQGCVWSLNWCAADEVQALILARGGSKGIPNKNLEKLNGTSLLGRTITILNSSNLFEHIWVSTDCELIASEAIKFGALVHKRDAIYARDNTSSLESVKEFLAAHDSINRVALFQCTSVFLKENYVYEALQQFESRDCAFAVTRSHKLRWKLQENGNIVPLNFKPECRPRRQDWPGELIETGMFYFSTRQLVMEENRFQNEKCGIVEIDIVDSLEIDTRTDLVLAECLIAQGSRITGTTAACTNLL
ncbi:PREDICTED: N-acylneuraminate cytidylyltransferase isoform X1 [Rhagoletis zephyria]|uniref:N-acylneuraminate cytidylyltransferase isoform X1 n=2 Tax=Rhagoletis zephyria TaxID=28612 RepID=UPI000811681F|nr:PREDICTED: N-acylneuraminate cytidylyltransferase isoform X1 [Rhagoletis zephyria]